MKRINKLLPLLCLVVLLAALCGTNAFAAGNAAVATSEFYTHEGENFTTTLYIPDGADIVDFDITLQYDSELITLVGIEENDDIKGAVVFNDSTAGKISINYTRTSKNVTSYLPLLDLTFKVDDNIGIGEYDCFTADKSAAYTAHHLNDNGSISKVDFECSFAKLVVYEMGDVDLSGEVDIGDATYLRRHLAELDGAVLTGFKLSLADTLCDGIIDIGDPVTLQRRLAGYDVVYGNRVNITFYDINGQKYCTKSVLFDGTLKTIPLVPFAEGYSEGMWSQSPDEYIAPDYTHVQSAMKLYAVYSNKEDKAMDYYKKVLTNMYYSGDMPTNLSSDLDLKERLDYESGCYAKLIWNSDSNYIINSTTGQFTKPTYPQEMSLTALITAYDANNKITSEGEITFNYKIPGIYQTPTKQEIEGFLQHYFTDNADGKYRVNYDVKLLSKLNNSVIPVEGKMYDNFEVRLAWYQNVDGELKPISQIKRTTSEQINDYVAVATFNGKPVDGDGKIYIDDVEVTPIEQIEIKNYIINQIAANMGTLATDGTVLWDNDNVYGTNVTWETGAPDIAYVANNVIQLKNDAVSGTILPVNARVSYAIDGGVEEFVLAYNLTVSCDNTIIKAPENMDPELYKAIKTELEDTMGYRGDLTSAALADVKFVNLDLSGYPDITSLRGLSYCKNLRTLNISGLHITDGTMNQIATLSYLEAFIARGCGLDNLSDGGQATLRNAVNLKLIDLTDNNFTSLDSVFAEGIKYGKLTEVYLSNNKLTDINALSRAPMMGYLSLSGNGLTTEGTASIENYPYLTYLSLANNKIDSVEHLKNLKYLKELRLQYNELTDVNDLRRLTNLEALYLGHNQIKDIGNLNTLTNLVILYANDNQIFDISNLRSLTKLEIVNVNNNSISSLAVLGNYRSTLSEIYAENNKITDLGFINGALDLHILMLSGNKIELAQDNMTSWLSELTGMEILTLSDIKLNDLSFLEGMTKLARLDVANCGLHAFSGDYSNVKAIADRYEKLRILNISDNDFSDGEAEILNLRNNTLLTVLYADNICIKHLDAYTLTYSMTELKYISLENCGITTMSWLNKFHDLAYVDLSGNDISEVSIEGFISNASLKTIKELYLDTNVKCSFADVYRVMDFNVERLSLAGVAIEKIEHMPFLDNIKYLNLSNTGLTNLVGDDPELVDLYSIERYKTLECIDVSGLQADISPIENIESINTVYAVGVPSSMLFYKGNLHALQRMYNKGVTCYLYDKESEYVPVAQKEGSEILNLIDDFSCDVTVAADNIFSANNPTLPSKINDYDITWTVSNPANYEIVNNQLSVKDYSGIEDETLTVTASITVYPDQAPVSRDFTINTSILRASPEYFSIDATGYSEQLTRDSEFNYALSLKAAETAGFLVPVKPVEDSIAYSYDAKDQNSEFIPYVNVLQDMGEHHFKISSTAQLNSTVTMCITISHNTKSGEMIVDCEPLNVPVTIATRTFMATFVLDGGTLTDANGLNRNSCAYQEDSLIFSGLILDKPGYAFEGWYTDAAFQNLFSIDGNDAIMPSMDITLYAKWRAVSYNLIFDATGGTVEPSSMLVLSDVAIGELPVPVREYYKFEGWFTAEGEQVTSKSKYATTNDFTVYALWAPNEYTVAWNTVTGALITVERTASPIANAEVGELSNGATVYYGDELTVSYTERVGYSITSIGKTSITVDRDITSDEIYAETQINSYTVEWREGTTYSISIERISSPHANAELGPLTGKTVSRLVDKRQVLFKEATVYYGDVLKVEYQAAEGYALGETGPNSVTVTSNIGSETIFGSATANRYTYNIVYRSSNGTALGTAKVTNKYGTTNTITAPAKTGYTTPAAQTVTWDSASAKTITFTYSPIPESNSYVTGTFTSSSPKITYSTTMKYRNRTATSVEVYIETTVTMQSGWSGYGYGVAMRVSGGSADSGKVQIASYNGLSSGGSSRTASTGWMKVNVGTTNATTLSFSANIYNTNWENNYVNSSDYADMYYTWSMKIPAY